MTISSIIALLVIGILFFLASRYLYKHGTCGSCPDAGACHGKCDRKSFKKDPEYEEKNLKIEEIMKKHGI